MSSAINPEAGQPSGAQAFEQSDRNPMVRDLVGADADGGQVPTPDPLESRVTQPGPTPSPDSGLTNYDVGDSADGVEDESESEG